jgi:hypothetical protein
MAALFYQAKYLGSQITATIFLEYLELVTSTAKQ